MSRKALNTRLKMLYRISPSNAATICEQILSEQTEPNIKIYLSTAENKVKALLWLARFFLCDIASDSAKSTSVNIIDVYIIMWLPTLLHLKDGN
jgi:hypothetical protein